jgi:hypothetical protein
MQFAAASAADMKIGLTVDAVTLAPGNYHARDTNNLAAPGAINGKTSPPKDLLGPLKSVEQRDEMTVRCVLQNPWPEFPAGLTFREVIPKAFAEKVGAAGLAKQQ